ncbi:MAG: bacillithiol biosynthesis deacetylase BshB1 [Balneolaceae bacterium]
MTDILAFGAHPDDTELGCAGTLAASVQQGKSVVVVDLTRGEMGTRGSAELRMKEAADAAAILGLTARDNLGLPDTLLTNTRDHHLPIIQKVRHYRPHVCILPAPADRHPDHGHAAALLKDAIFYAGLAKIETIGDDGKPQEPHRPHHILHYMQDTPFEPDFVFDITHSIDLKEEAIKAFSSQFNVSDPGREPETYVSGIAFFEALRARARLLGHRAGFAYGEGFLAAQKPISLTSLDLFLSTSPKR